MKYRYKGLIVVVSREKENFITLRNVKDNSIIITDKESFKRYFTPIREQKPLPATPEPQRKQEKTDFTPKTKVIKKGKKEIEIMTLF